jgi:hypothetical protein
MVAVLRLSYHQDAWDERYEDWYEEAPTPENWAQPAPNSEEGISSAESLEIIESEFLDYLHFRYLDLQPFQDLIEKGRTSESIEQRFYRLAHEWREETAHLSSLTKLVMHPKYQSIIGMGPDVLPILFRELQKKPDHWFWALRAITEEDPTRPEDAGNIRKMREAWLRWAEEKGYL